MPRSLSLTSAQINALTTGDNTILFNAQSRDILLYGGANLEGKIGALEIDNLSGDCLTLKYNASATNFVNFALTNAGTFNVNVNGGNKLFNIVNHNGSSFGLSLGGTLVTSSASQLNTVNVTPGTAAANKAVILDGNLDITGIHNLETDNLTVNGTLVTASATELNYTDITTAGTAQASKALVVDVNKDIAGIRDLTATGILDVSSHNGDNKGLKLGGVMISALSSDINKLSAVTEGTVTASKVLIVDSNKDLSSLRHLTTSGNLNLSNHDGSTTGFQLAGTLVTSSASQLNTVNVTPGTAAANKAVILDGNLDITGIHNLETDNLTVNGTLVTASATELNYTDITTAGTVQASKAVIVDVDKDIAGFRNLTTDGNINIYNYNGTTVGLKLAGNLVTSSASEINTLDGVTPGTVTAGKALVVDSNKDLSEIRNLDVSGGLNITNHDGSTIGLELGGTLVTASASEINKLTGVTPGTVTGGKTLIVDSNRDLSSIRNLTSSGSIDISNYNGTTTGLKLAGTLITSSAAEINTLAGVTAGTVTASKALVVDANNDLASLRNVTLTGTLSGVTTLTATTLAGTLSTTAQPNVTSVGSLTGLTTAGLTLGSTAITTTGNEINILDGVTATTSEINTLAGVTATTSEINKLSGVTATTSEINKLAGVTPGTATTSKTLVLNSSGNISGINSISTTNLIINGVNITSSGGGSIGPDYTTGVTPGTANANSSLVLDVNKDISGINSLSSTTLTGTLSTSAQVNITSTGNLTLPGSLTITNGGTPLNFTNTSSSSNFRLSIDGTSGNIDIRNNNTSNITLLSLYANGKRQLTCINDNDYVNLPNHNGSSTGLQLAGTLVTSTAVEINTLSGVTAGTVAVSKALVVDANKDLSSLRNLTLTGTLSGVTTLGLSGVITSTNVTSTSSNTTGALVLSGGIGISNATDATSSTNGGTFTSSGGGAFAKSLYIGTNLIVGGNLTISGTTTSVNSTNVLINDNIISLNSGPSGTGFDSGFLTQRYQIDNTGGVGDVVNDTVEETYALSAASSTTITLPGGANATTDYYKGWWIKITSGSANNHVRQITSYNGTTKVATLVTAFSTTPVATNTVNLYNKPYSAFVWQEANDRFVTAYTAVDPTSGSVNIIDYADFATNNQNILSTTTSTSNTTGALKLAGGIGISNTTNATSISNGGTFTSAGGGAFAKELYAGGQITTTNAGIGFSHNDGVINLVSYVNNTLANIAYFGTNTNHGLNIQTNNFSRLSFDTSGNVDISQHNGSTIGLKLGGTLVTSTAVELNFLASVTAGTAAASKALVLNSSSNITTGINSLAATTLTATTLTGTLSTAAQTSITSVGTLTGLTVSGSSPTSTRLRDTGTSSVAISLDVSHYLSSGTAANGIGSSMIFNAPNSGGSVITYGKISAISSNVTAGSHAGGLFFASVFNGAFVDSLNLTSSSATNSTLALLGASSTISAANMTCTGTLTLGGSALTASSFSALIGVTAGTATASKALIVDGSKNIAGIGAIALDQNVSRPFSILNSALTTGNNVSFVLGKANTTDQQGEFTFKYNSTTGLSYLALGHFGSPGMLSISSNGNIGIGNTSPGTKLDVNGSVSIGGTMTCNGSTSTTGNYTCTAGIFYGNKSTASATFVSNWISSSYLGIGPDTTSSDNTIRLGICSNAGVWSGYANIKCNAINVNSGDVRVNSGRSFITSSGYGFSHFGGSATELITYSDGSVTGIGSYTSHPFGLYSGNLTQRLTVQTNGQIAIGTGSDQLGTNVYPLYVRTWCSSNESVSVQRIYATTLGATGVYDNNTWGHCSARFNDNVLANNFISISDRRVKTNIEEIPDVFCKEFVMNCTPVSYKFKKDLSRGVNNTQFGYIAQDLEKKGFGYLVTQFSGDDDENLMEVVEDVNGIEYKSPAGVLLSVSYSEIIPLLAQNIKKLYLENDSKDITINDQKNKITTLENKVNDLESRLKKLEEMLLNN